MISLAINYSPQAAELLRRGEISLDLFKCPPWPALVADAEALRPVMMHFDFQAGRGLPNAVEIERATKLHEASATFGVNTHFSPLRKDFEAVPEAQRREAIFERSLADLGPLAERFGAERVVVENVPWERRAGFEIDRLAADPHLLRRLVEASGAGLLLDLAHARFAAEELGLPVRELVEALPVERLRELHVTGLGFDADGRRRDHMAMTEADVELLAWALDNIAAGRWSKPWAVALEYGGVGPLFEWRSERDVVAADLTRLAVLLAERGLR